MSHGPGSDEKDEQGVLWELPSTPEPTSDDTLPPSLDITAPVVAITGHRPARIMDESKVREGLFDAIVSLKPRLLIQGMADGVDLWSAAAAWKAGVPYQSVLPWAGHHAGKKIARDWVLEHSEEVVVLNEAMDYPGPWVFRIRNEWMVDRAEVLIAVWDGKASGGTYHAVKYAKSKGLQIVRVGP